MNWIPEGADLLTLAGAVLAALSALTAIAVALAQVSRLAKARKTLEWIRDSLVAESDSERQASLHRLRIRAEALLISSYYVPAWKFAEVILWTLASPALLLTTAMRSDANSQPAPVWYLVVTINLAGVFRRAIRLSCEKTRVRTQYALGGRNYEPVRVDLMEQMEGGTRKEFIIALAGAIGVTTLLYGAFWKFIGEGHGILPFLVFLAGFLVVQISLMVFHSYSRKLAIDTPRQAEGGEDLGII
ncbi:MULTISPECIES: hypothetical protein [unclassified Dietzia]|uniref:hypothetical protein n=1 Tax=unclassified Dietzia TaxID=2617939 RepID=UPI0012E7E95D|nr:MULTISPECIES: hypothetical protein [unclassified Dietzia]